jgi:hypothetical protein
MRNIAAGAMSGSAHVGLGYGLRGAALIIAAILVLAACSGGGSGGPGVASVSSSSVGSPSAGRSTTSPSAVGYSRCMRDHGVPNYPDPTSSNAVIKVTAQQLGVGSSQLQAAQHACQPLIPSTGDTVEQQQELQCAQTGDCPQAVIEQWMSGLRMLARCLRTHGEPNWPDPIIASLGGHPPAPHYPYEQAGIDHHSQKLLHEVQECAQITGFQGLPLP